MFLTRVSNFRLAAALSCAAMMTIAGCSSNNSQRSEAIDNDDTTPDMTRVEHNSGNEEDGLMQRLLPDSPLGTQRTADGMTRSSMAFPTGRTSTSAVLVEKMIPSVVNKGETFDYTISVKNISDLTLDDVRLADSFSDDFDLESATPRAGRDSSSGNFVWDLGSLAPGEAKTIAVRGSAQSTGTVGACASVSYDSSVCILAEVVEPALQLAKTATPRVSQCDMIVYTYTVTNDGSGAANNVRIMDRFDRGITLQDGGSQVNIEVGTLAPGQSREFTVMAKASSTGEFASEATATAEPGLSAESSEPETVVVKPELAISVECPDDQYIGRNSTYEITVENTGDGDAMSSRVMATLPAGTSFVRASDGGVRNGNQVVWDAGTLRAGADRSMSVTVSATEAGSKNLRAQATANCADAVNDTCTTTYRGIPAILLEVVDITDPVEVGQQTTYVITATNQGSAPDTNVKIVCELPDSMAYVSGTGTTTVSHRGGTVTMANVGSLGVGQQAVWRVTIRATDEDNARFGVTMTSDELGDRPVEETEATNLYR